MNKRKCGALRRRCAGIQQLWRNHSRNHSRTCPGYSRDECGGLWIVTVFAMGSEVPVDEAFVTFGPPHWTACRTFKSHRNVTDTPVRCTATTTIFLFATQGAWRIPIETVCSFQAAILQTPDRSFRGMGSIRNKENRCNRSGSLTCGSQQMNNLSAWFLPFTCIPDVATHTESL